MNGYEWNDIKTKMISILLGLPVFSKRSQTWTGLLDAERINRKSKATRESESNNSQDQQSVHTTLENDRCKSGLNIYFTTKCIQLGATWCNHSSENWTGLGRLDFPEVLRTVRRNEAQHSVEAILISRGSILISLDKDAETEINPGVSMAHNGSIQH